jgi:hypothetical protein
MELERYYLENLKNLKGDISSAIAWIAEEDGPANINNGVWSLMKVLDKIKNPVYIKQLEELLTILEKEAEARKDIEKPVKK